MHRLARRDACQSKNAQLEAKIIREIRSFKK